MRVHSNPRSQPRLAGRALPPRDLSPTPHVGVSLHPVGGRRQTSVCYGLARVLRALTLTFGIAGLGACADDPEQLLCSRWRESEWSYERLDPPPEPRSFSELLALTRQRDRRIVRHEAEYWEFRCDRALVISKQNGEKLHRRWQLKGRGHVLTITGDDPSQLEIYDVKELNARELVLHYDIGMELRGIARLTFRKAEPGAAGVASARGSIEGEERRDVVVARGK